MAALCAVLVFRNHFNVGLPGHDLYVFRNGRSDFHCRGDAPEQPADCG